MTVINLEQCRTTGPVRVVGVVSRCRNCSREFRTALDADNRVPPEALACGDPRCLQHSPEPPTAA